MGQVNILIIFGMILSFSLEGRADLVKAAQEGVSDEDIEKLLVQRKKVCLTTPQVNCYSLEDITSAICDTEKNKLSFYSKKNIWLSVLNEKTTPSQISKTLYTLRRCDSSDEYKKTIGLVFFLTAWENKNKKLSDFLIKWLSTLNKNSDRNEILLYSTHLSSFSYFLSVKPFELDEATNMSKSLLHYLMENSAWKKSKKYVGDQAQVLSQWMYSVSSRLLLDADMDLFSKAIEKNQFLLTSVNPEDRFLILQNLCLHWYNNSLSHKCISLSQKWLNIPIVDKRTQESRLLFEIRLAFLRGDYESAEKKVKELTENSKASLEKDTSRMAWLQLELSFIYASQEKINEARKALANFEIYCNGLPHSFCRLYASNSKTFIDTVEMSCSKVIEDAQNVNSVFLTQIKGVPYDLIVSTYYQLYCLAHKEDKQRFANSYTEFERLIGRKTSVTNYKLYASLLKAHMSKQNFEFQLNNLSSQSKSDLELKLLRKLLKKSLKY